MCDQVKKGDTVNVVCRGEKDVKAGVNDDRVIPGRWENGGCV